MGLMSRVTTIFKAKAHKFLDKLEDPTETLEYSYERQLELLRKAKRGLAEVMASKKRLELQVIKLRENANKLEQQAREALRLGKEDLAKAALERRQIELSQVEGLESQIAELEKEQQKLAAVEARLQAKVQAFRTKKEVIKAQYSAAEAQVKIGEAATGLSEELADVGLAIERAEEKTEKMKARAAAIDEMVELGLVEDYLGGKDKIQAELDALKVSQSVDQELERLKREASAS